MPLQVADKLKNELILHSKSSLLLSFTKSVPSLSGVRKTSGD